MSDLVFCLEEIGERIVLLVTLLVFCLLVIFSNMFADAVCVCVFKLVVLSIELWI